MKRLAAFSLFVIIAGCRASAPVPPSPNKDWSIAITWQYDFTNFAWCSSTQTKGCITGFTWGYLQSGVAVPLKTSAVTATLCPITAQPQTCTDSANSTLGIGPITYFVTTNAIDNNGAVVTSAEGLSPVDNVALGSALNVTVTRK